MQWKTGRDTTSGARVEPAADPSPPGSRLVWCPPTDVLLADGLIVVRLELAGARPSDVRARVDEAELVVWGQRPAPSGPQPRRIDRMEIAFGPFERVVPLPEPVLPEEARATLADGLLEVVLPLAEMRIGRTTTIEIVLSVLS